MYHAVLTFWGKRSRQEVRCRKRELSGYFYFLYAVKHRILILNMRVLFLFTLTLTLLLCSCQKEIRFPETPKPVTNQIKLQYVPLHGATTRFELIITDSVNEVVLDTMLSVNEQHKIEFEEGGYSLTTIEYDDTEKKYKSRTYIDADASDWVIRPVDENQNLGSNNIASGADAKIQYQNVPTYTGFIFYKGSQVQNNSSVSITPMPSQKKIEVAFKRLDQYISYLMIPSLGKYKIHPTTSANDVVDCSQMETAKNINYTKPGNIVNSYINLFGFLNATDYNNGVQLFHTDPVIFGDDYDLVYPDKGIARYFFYGLFADSDGGQYTYNSFNDAVPQTLDFVDASYFDVVANQPGDFEISFLKDAPSLYYLSYNSSKLQHIIYAAPDQNSINPSQFAAALAQSELLGGESLAGYKVDHVAYYKADNYSYPAYLNYIFSPAPGTDKIKLSKTYSLPLP